MHTEVIGMVLFMKSIDWFITNNCSSTCCPFCYAPREVFPDDNDLSGSLEIASQILKQDIECVTLCGGEPLEYKYINEVVRFLSGKVKIIFYAGRCINNVIPLLDYINTISLPFEAVNRKTQNLLRGEKVHTSVLRLLDYIRRCGLNQKMKVKIGTVVNAVNINEIKEIYYRLLEYSDVIDVWRLYMLSPYGLAAKNRTLLQITSEQYKKCVDEIKELEEKANHHFLICERTREENKGYCFIMDSMGRFYKYEEKYVPLNVTIFDGFEKIERQYDLQKYKKQKSWQS